MQLEEWLVSIGQWVRVSVGDEVWAGALLNDAATPDVSIELYGTDADLVELTLDELAPDRRDRFVVVEVENSLSALRNMSRDAELRLTQAGIFGSTSIRPGVDPVVVELFTADGAPDAGLEADVTDLMADLPVVIEFGQPPTPAADS